MAEQWVGALLVKTVETRSDVAPFEWRSKFFIHRGEAEIPLIGKANISGPHPTETAAATQGMALGLNAAQAQLQIDKLMGR